jgi:hypothetical protein
MGALGPVPRSRIMRRLSYRLASVSLCEIIHMEISR